MEKYYNTKTIDRIYKNEGQHIEQVTRYNLTGELVKADNAPYWMATDVGNIQIKSYHATICVGTDISAHLAQDLATHYLYMINELEGFLMDKAEYLEFATAFNYVTKDSRTDAIKLRFLRQRTNIKNYLEARV